MGKPVVHPKPDLSHFATRQMVIPPTRDRLEAKLLEWITELLNHTKHPHNIRHMAPARYLLSTAEGIDEIMTAPASMTLGAGGSTQTVDARFHFGGMPDGNWYIEHVRFVPRLNNLQRKIIADDKEADARALRKRLEDSAIAENRLHPKARAFPAEHYIDTWQADIEAGLRIIEREMEVAHGHAQKAASIPDNPYSPKDVAISLVGAGVGQLGKTSERAEQLAGVYEKTDQAISATQKLTTIAEDRNAILEGKKSRGDVVVERAIDLAADMPVVGPFVKGFAGMIYDFASANFAGEVTKIRCRAYAWYVAGFVQGLTLAIQEIPKNGFDNFYYVLAYNRAHGLPVNSKFQAQMALLFYASEHYTAGDWGGTRLERPGNWHFPDDYLAHWSPELLGRAMTTQLCRKRFLLD